MRLTEISIRALKGSATYTTYFDDTVPGFGVRVGKRSKTYIVLRGKKRERVSIGKVGDLSLAEARTEAKRLLSAEPEQKPAAITFKEARDRFLEDHYRGKSENTKYQVSRSLKRHFASLDSRKLADIDDEDVQTVLDKLAGTPSEQLHAFRYIRCFFRWCTRRPRRFIKHSPMEGYDAPGSDKKGTRTLTDAELVAVWNAAEGPTHRVVRLLVLWGTRNSETAALERAWRSDDVLTLPGEHTKNGRDHAIPILPLAELVLSHSIGNNEHYFAGRWGTGHLSARGLAMIVSEVKKLSGTKGWTPRDIRRTFRTNLTRLKVPQDVAELLINHARPTLHEIYDRYERIDEKREALEKYEAFLIALLAAEKTEARESPQRETRDEASIEEISS